MAAERFGPYRLDELIGRGGMGEVYRAFDTVKERTVALKRLPVALAADTEFQARFRKESALAARLSEPHIIPIHDYGVIDGQLFIDMRLVVGRVWLGCSLCRGRCGRRWRWTSWGRWRGRWMPRTPTGWCIGTSSRRMC